MIEYLLANPASLRFTVQQMQGIGQLDLIPIFVGVFLYGPAEMVDRARQIGWLLASEGIAGQGIGERLIRIVAERRSQGLHRVLEAGDMTQDRPFEGYGEGLARRVGKQEVDCVQGLLVFT